MLRIITKKLTFLLCVVLFARPDCALAGVPEVRLIQVKDGVWILNYRTAIGDILYFCGGQIDSSDYELWRTDGTEQGTYRVKDINPGPEKSYPYPFVVVNDTLFFAADDGVHGRELWKSDGTEAGTVLVKDIWPGPQGDYPTLIPFGEGLLLAVDDGVHGRELWKSDGTQTGTVLVKDIKPGGSWTWSGISGLVNVDGTAFFRADDGIHGNELWKSDGTEAGTVLVKDIWPGWGNGRDFYCLVNVNGTLFFWEPQGGELWRSDGTAAGTVLVKDIFEGSEKAYCERAKNIYGTYYFCVGSHFYGYALWKSDGTAAGTVRVKNIRPDDFAFAPESATNPSRLFFFKAWDGAHGFELWKSDGTEGGTVALDIRPGPFSSFPESMTFVNDTLFFQARDDAHGQELWMSDGTVEGSVLVKDMVPGPQGACPGALTSVNGVLYFGASDGGSGGGLWKAVLIPNPPIVTGTSPTYNKTPTWTWTGGGHGNGTYRYKLDDADLVTGAATTTETSYTPGSPLSLGDHALYVQEQNDQGYWSDSGSFTIIIEVNEAPVAHDLSAGTECDVAVPIAFSATDPEGQALTFMLVEGPDNGTVIINGSSAVYYPDVDFIGTDSFTFKANDGNSDSNVATVSITVNQAGALEAAVGLDLERHILFFPRRIEAEEFTLSGLSTTSVQEFSRGTGVQLANGGFIDYAIPFATGGYILRVRYKTDAGTGSSDLVVYVNGQEKGRVALAGDQDTMYLKKTDAVSLATNDILRLQLAGAPASTVKLDFVEFFPTQSSAPVLTIAQNAGQTLKAGENVAIFIPAGIFSEWDSSVGSVALGGNAAAKVSAGVSYCPDNKACVLNITQDLAAGDEIEVSGLRFISQDIASGPGRLKLALNGDWQHVVPAPDVLCAPIAAVKMGARSLSPGRSQEIAPVTIIEMIPPQIQKDKGLKLVIPDDVPAAWDNSMTTVTISGTAKDRVGPQVGCSANGKELTLQVIEDFFFADCLKLTGLKAIASRDCLFRAIVIQDGAGRVIAARN